MYSKIVSAIMLSLLVTSALILAVNVQPAWANETVYIRPDGSIEGTTYIQTADNVTYIFTADINDSIVVQRDNIVVDGAGYVVQGTGAFPTTGIDLTTRNNVTIKNTNVRGFTSGIFLQSSSQNNVVVANNVTNNQYGIYLFTSSSGNNVSDNNAQDNNQYGILLHTCSGNNISSNDVANNGGPGGWGIALYYASNNEIAGNNITSNPFGLFLDYSSTINNSLYENRITSSSLYGICISTAASYNKVYHNNFIGNSVQAYIGADCVGNTWNDTYPSGGNYWSDYNGTDNSKGPYQNETGNDGIGDTPYTIDADNKDNYPLMHPWNPLPVHNGNTGLAYASIQEAIDANETLDGHTIYIDEGTYVENVIVQKSLSFLGAGNTNTIIQGGLEPATFTVAVNNVQVSNLNIRGGRQGIYFSGSSNNTVSENIFSLSYEGVLLETTTNTNISRNTFSDCSFAVSLSSSSNNTVSENNVQLNSFSILLTTSSNNTICRNNITGGSFNPGIWLQEASCDNAISDNNVINNPVGLWLYTSSNDNAVSGNDIAMTGKQLFSADGITVEQSVGNVFYENQVENYTDGVRTLASNSKFYHNSFINNTRQVELISGSNSWDDGYPSGGNYWSDYEDTDSYKGPYQNETGCDGIWDNPYGIGSDNRDGYPLTKEFGGLHDLGLTDVETSKTRCLPVPTIGRGFDLNITSSVLNYAASSESFNLTVYANSSWLETAVDVSVEGRTSTVLNVICDTNGLDFGNYTLSIHAGPVIGETDTTDNTLYCWIVVTIPGDVNGEFTVDIFDAILLASSYGSDPASSNWNPNSDINCDNGVDIYDAIILANHYNQRYP